MSAIINNAKRPRPFGSPDTAVPSPKRAKKLLPVLRLVATGGDPNSKQLPPNFYVVPSVDEQAPTLLGRTNPHFAGLLDVFVSRVAAKAVADENSVSLEVHGSNPIRILRADGTSEVKAKGTVCTLYPGDRVDLSFNAKQNIGHYRLLVTHIEPDHEAIYTMAPVATSLLHKPPTSTQAFTQAQLASQPVPNSTPQLSELSESQRALYQWLASIGPEFTSYYPKLVAEGFNSIEDLKMIEEEDLRELDFHKLLHRKKLMEALKVLKRQSDDKTDGSTSSQTSTSGTVAPEPRRENGSSSTVAEAQSSQISEPPKSQTPNSSIDDLLKQPIKQEIKEEQVEIPRPLPPPPLPLCEGCNELVACFSCTDCSGDPCNGRKLCFGCNLILHIALPKDIDSHVPSVLDQEVLDAQRTKVETHELQIQRQYLDGLKSVFDYLDKILAIPFTSKDQLEALIQEKNALVAKCKLPETQIVVMGDTGAGKSTMLNALLGEEAVLPTNGMRACTAAIIEIRWQDTSSPYRYSGEIEFLTKEEWESELKLLFEDLRSPETGKLLKRPDPQSNAGVALAKLKVVYGPIDLEKIDRVEQLLKMQNKITRALSTKKYVHHNDPIVFRELIEQYADSSNETTDLAYWPLVKRITLKGPWEALRGGAVLVDAPGVRDDNSARDNCVKSYLRTGTSIWIVSNIKRAVNDRTAKEMLGESFRRQLLMDGLFGSLAFVATHADLINRTELIRNLGLPKTATKEECAKKRNAYTKARIKADFRAGLEEMASRAGEEVSNMRGYYLPVFTVASFDFQKLIGNVKQDDEPPTFKNQEDTEIPALRRYVYEVTFRRRYETLMKLHRDAQQLIANIDHFLHEEGTADHHLRQRVYTDFKGMLAAFQQRLEQLLQQLEVNIRNAIAQTIISKLPDGINTAVTQAVPTATRWGAPVNRAERSAGGLHWATYKATVRRHGVFGSPTAGSINFNEELVEPIYRKVSVHWDNLFGVQLAQVLNNHLKSITELMHNFNLQLGNQIKSYGVDNNRIIRNIEYARNAGVHRISAALNAVLETVRERQMQISRVLAPFVQQTMGPAYTSASAACGAGSFAVMKNIIVGQVDKCKDTMFADSAKLMLQQINQLVTDVILASCKSINDLIIQQVTLANQAYWDVPIDNKAARDSVGQCLQKLKAQLQTASEFLAQSQFARTVTLPPPQVIKKSEESGVASGENIEPRSEQPPDSSTNKTVEEDDVYTRESDASPRNSGTEDNEEVNQYSDTEGGD